MRSVLQVFSRTKNTTSTGLRLEYALEGTTNFVALKIHMEEILDDNGFLDYIKTDVIKHPTYDVEDLTQWKKDVAKARRIIWRESKIIFSRNSMGKKLHS